MNLEGSEGVACPSQHRRNVINWALLSPLVIVQLLGNSSQDTVPQKSHHGPCNHTPSQTLLQHPWRGISIFHHLSLLVSICFCLWNAILQMNCYISCIYPAVQNEHLLSNTQSRWRISVSIPTGAFKNNFCFKAGSVVRLHRFSIWQPYY